jgi:hypothetical protein
MNPTVLSLHTFSFAFTAVATLFQKKEKRKYIGTPQTPKCSK